MRFALGLVASLLIATPSFADIELLPERTFRALIVCAHAVDCVRAQEIFLEGVAYIRRVVPVNFQIVGRVTIQEEMTGSAEERYDKWQLRTEGLARALDVDVVHIAVGMMPLMTDQVDWQAEGVMGIAELGSLGYRSPAFFMTKIAGSNQYAARIVAHEVGHLLGALHSEHGLMGWATSITQLSDAFDWESIDQMRQHLAWLP